MPNCNLHHLLEEIHMEIACRFYLKTPMLTKCLTSLISESMLFMYPTKTLEPTDRVLTTVICCRKQRYQVPLREALKSIHHTFMSPHNKLQVVILAKLHHTIGLQQNHTKISGCLLTPI